jgi:hypothetical protein
MEGLLDLMKEVGQEINAEKTKYMFMFHHQSASKNYNVGELINSMKRIQCSLIGNDLKK